MIPLKTSYCQLGSSSMTLLTSSLLYYYEAPERRVPLLLVLLRLIQRVLSPHTAQGLVAAVPLRGTSET
jgi:hypothetical protein